jgi:Gram-negative bacterial TonB protein C-terminal
LISIIIFNSTISGFAQAGTEKDIKSHSCSIENVEAVREYFAHFDAQRTFMAACRFESDKRQEALGFPKPFRISGFGPRPISLVEPYYPEIAKRFRIFGSVAVEVVTDEHGAVIYSKVFSGNSFLRESVRRAACASRFTPVFYCGKPVKEQRQITYNFITS